MSSVHRRSSRVPGPVLVVALLALVAAAVAGAWYALGKRPSAAGAVELAAIDGEYAVLIRDVASDPGRSFLSLMHARRGEVWGALIPAYEAGRGPGSRVVTTTGVISVRVPTGGVPYVRVFDAARGDKLGRYALVPVERDEQAPPVTELMGNATSMAGNGHSFELLAVDGTAVAVALDLTAGIPLWRRELGPAPVGPVWLREHHLLVYGAGRLQILDRLTGQPAPGADDGVAMEAWPCVLAERVYGMDQGAVRVISISDGRTRTADALAGAALAGMCGSHGDHDVLAVNDAQGASALVAVDPASLAPRWRVELGVPLLVPAALHLGAPDAMSLTGDLPRFVPLLAGEDRAPRLVLVDVESGRISRQSTPAPQLAGARIMHAGGRFYLWAPQGSPGTATLAAIDGATGTLEAAATLESAAPVWPGHIAGGHVWIHDESGRDTAAWAVLDGERLTVVSSGQGNRPADPGPLRVTDTRDALARGLGMP